MRFPSIIETAADADNLAVKKVGDALDHLLANNDRLDLVLLRDQAAYGLDFPRLRDDFAELELSAKTFALDPFIMGEHIIKAAMAHPFKRRCSIVARPARISRKLVDGHRALWEVVIRGWWVPSRTVAGRGGL